MDIFENEIKNLKLSSTFLLYSDFRINLLDEANKFAYKILGRDIHNNPDYYYYSELKMEDVRELITRVSESSYYNRKVYVIDKIEFAKKEVLNAILKVIEEPPKNVYFILLTRRMDILDNGIVMTGGGSMIKDFPTLMEKEVKVKVYLTENPLNSVVLGGGKVFDNKKLLKTLQMKEN